MKDNKIFHLITILLFYSNYNVMKQCVKKIAGVIRMRYSLVIVCYRVHFRQKLYILSTYIKMFCLNNINKSIFINYFEITIQMSKIFRRNSLKHNEMLVTRPIGARHYLTRTCFVVILWRYNFKASLLSHPSLWTVLFILMNKNIIFDDCWTRFVFFFHGDSRSKT